MMTYIKAILTGMQYFTLAAAILTAPIVASSIQKDKTVDFIRVICKYAMLFYGICLAAVVFLPLPTASQAAALQGHQIQVIPFHFIMDIIKESTLVITKPSTYVPALYNQAAMQVVLNIIMTVPLGAFLRYYYGMSVRKIILVSAAVSVFIEVTQLTGIYGIYQGSYRLCDIDDVMANTLGGYAGYRMVQALSHILPSMQILQARLANKRHALHTAK